MIPLKKYRLTGETRQRVSWFGTRFIQVQIIRDYLENPEHYPAWGQPPIEITEWKNANKADLRLVMNL